MIYSNLRFAVFLVPALASLSFPFSAKAFCGFYVSKADASLFNQASQVVIARHENRTVLTMVNDYQGDTKNFAMVVPVPTVLKKEQIHIGNMADVDHLDAYTAPRLVEYHDPNPCDAPMRILKMEDVSAESAPRVQQSGARGRAERLGVKIEASYTVGEYDILILSATQSDGLIQWLQEEKYQIPEGAEPVVGSYLKQGFKFFVAKVNLEAKAKAGYNKLRPLQMAFETERFGLPIRLGTANAQEKQDLIIYLLTQKGRVQTTNYRTVKLPSDVDLPLFVRDRFADFYRDLFSHQAKKENHKVVFLEYAWDMGWCDPCAADPLSPDQLRGLGVSWLADRSKADVPERARIMPRAPDVFVTRLHLRYDGESFPADLQFQMTADRSNFQGRYILRNPAVGDLSCKEGQRYLSSLNRRWKKDGKRLASLTGWSLEDIYKDIDFDWIKKRHEGKAEPTTSEPWWRRLWR